MCVGGGGGGRRWIWRGDVGDARYNYIRTMELIHVCVCVGGGVFREVM